jgi:hypothetical protein
MGDFFHSVGRFISNGFWFLITLAIIAVVFLVWQAVRIGILNLLHYFEDYTTGFTKVKNMLLELVRLEIEKMNENQFIGENTSFGLDIGQTESSGYSEVLRLPGSFRSTHMYVVGASGSGKSSLLKNLIIQDIQSGMGIAVIDPHGDLISDLIPFIGKRMNKTVMLDLSDTEHILAYNPLERRQGVSVAEQVAKLILAFKRIWSDSWGARMEDILRNTLALLIEQGYTLAEFEKVLVDADFRDMLIENSMNDQAIEYFRGRFNTWNSKERGMYIESSLNKVSAFMSDERIGLRLAQAKSSFNVKDIMNSSGILLVNLAKGRLAGNADLFGALLMADIEMSFLSRTASERLPFALYADEFQNIATESFDTILAEARKFGLCLTMAHQSLKQLDEKLISLILGNAQTQIYFRVNREDSERFAKESENIVKQLEEQDSGLLQEPARKFNLAELWEVAFHRIARLPARQAYIMVKGVLEHPEQIRTLDNPIGKPISFPFDDGYKPMTELVKVKKGKSLELEKAIKAFTVEQKKELNRVVVKPPNDLNFIK